MTERLPTLFVSHGSPDLVISDRPAAAELRRLGERLPVPERIIVLSAHWASSPVGITGAAAPETIHDFRGFPDALYDRRYPAPGDPALAERIRETLEQAGIPARVDAERGLDHGAWAPLSLLFPQAQIPVVQVALPRGSFTQGIRLGQALAGLREPGVLILGSGNTVHNLRALDYLGETSPWAQHFEDWLREAVEEQGLATLESFAGYPESFALAHPTPDHLAPLPLVWAAAGPDAPGRRILQGFDLGNIGMSCYAFGEDIPVAWSV